jgi:lysyl-tRNA synthetase class 2
MSQHLSEQERIRREALNQLRDLGIEPYPAEAFPVDTLTTDLKNNFAEGKKVVMAGRLMSRRIMGKASFAELQDSAGRFQLYFNRDEICPDEDKTNYNTVFKKLLDIGDFIGIEGETFITQVGEPSVNVTSLKVLSKTIRPLPVVKTDSEGHVLDAFTDPELRYRMRYVDLVVNPDVKETFILRSRIISSMRDFLTTRGYLEVETPILQSIPGGAAARPFITHHNALDVPLYLRVANELYLKRLIVGGFDGVFEFAKDFRNEGMDKTHNPEFSQMEIYVSYKDYNWMMDFTEEMLESICLKVLGTTEVQIGDNEVSFKRPFKRISMIDAINEHTGIDISDMDEDRLRAVCRELNVEIDDSMGKGKLIDEIFGEKCEHNYIQPTFIKDYPVEMSPLCKKHRDNPELTERFELMVNGKELANAYSELNDPIDQRERFEEQAELLERGDHEAMFIDQDFIRSLEYGMPPTSGMGIGIDRLCMFLTNNDSIQEVLLFPQMRPEVFESGPSPSDFQDIGVPEAWVEHVISAGFDSVDMLKETKPTAIHQKLNGYRKKNKLDVPALQLDEIEGWLASADSV